MTTTQNNETQAAMTPAAALEHLLAGNRRFREGRNTDRDLLQQVAATSKGQWPFAAVVGCIDSRVPAEVVFDQGIGDLFNVRIAGNFANEDVLGSLEFACKVAGAKLLVVLGHTHCGAIKGACDDVHLGHLTGLLAKLKGAVDAVAEPVAPELRTSGNADFVQAVARANVARTCAAIRDRSDTLRELEAAGTLLIVGAMYDVESGGIELLEPAAEDR